MAYSFVTDCVSANGDDINEMVDIATEITVEEFLDKLGASPREKLMSLGLFHIYENFDEVLADWHISYFESTYQGKPCVYVCHSGIEHIFADIDV